MAGSGGGGKLAVHTATGAAVAAKCTESKARVAGSAGGSKLAGRRSSTSSTGAVEAPKHTVRFAKGSVASLDGGRNLYSSSHIACNLISPSSYLMRTLCVALKSVTIVPLYHALSPPQ